jgi:outer membrane usher protein
LGGRTYLAASVNYSPAFKPHTAVTLSLVVPLGRQQTFSSETTLQGSHPASTVEFAKQLGPGTDYGYRIRSSLDDHSQIDSAFSYQNGRGMYEVQASQGSDGQAWRLHEAGTLAWMHRYVLVSRTVGDSFAVVQVPETKGVRVYANNQLIGTTDRRGLLVVPSLVPYQRNTVRLDDAGIALDREIELADKFAVPMFRSGVFLKFNAESLGGALFRLVTADGSPVPLGAGVSANGKTDITEVALHGEAYVQHVSFPIHLIVRWDGGGCQVRLPARPPGNPLLPIGPLACKEAK